MWQIDELTDEESFLVNSHAQRNEASEKIDSIIGSTVGEPEDLLEELVLESFQFI